MNGSKVRDNIILAVLLILLAGAAYYSLFYVPLRTEVQSVGIQAAALEKQTAAETARIQKLEKMKKELNSLSSSDHKTEVADYDNSKAIMSQLNGILSSTDNYSLSFGTPAFDSNNVARRQVAVTFTAPDYAAAKTVVRELAQGQWRCLVNSVAFSSSGGAQGGDIMSGAVSVNAAVTYFERASSSAAPASSAAASVSGASK